MSDEQTAAAIVADSRNACDETAMEAAIVRALRAARKAPPGHIIDDAGRVLKVSGTLPVTADGLIGGSMSPVWTIVDGVVHRCYLSMIGELGTKVFVAGTTRCYSTREAAEAAKEAKA